MLSSKICCDCWEVAQYGRDDNPWQCRLSYRDMTIKRVTSKDEPPAGCLKLFEQVVYASVNKKS